MPSLAHHLLPGGAWYACIQSGVEPPHSIIRRDLWANVSPTGKSRSPALSGAEG